MYLKFAENVDILVNIVYAKILQFLFIQNQFGRKWK